MLLSLTTALFLFSSLSVALPGRNALRARSNINSPNAAFQIYSANPDKSMNLGSTASETGTSTTTYGRRQLASRDYPFYFHVSKGPNNSDREDLIVSFRNLPCNTSHGPYSFEFDFAPEPEYSSEGEGQINVFKLNGELPSAPTFSNIAAMTGSLIGTFELPSGSDANSPHLTFINQLVCEPTINLRFGITEYSSGAGAVVYFVKDSMGLRERDGF